MMCPQHLWHSLACTEQHTWLGEMWQRVGQKEKGKRMPWWAEHVQHPSDRIGSYGQCEQRLNEGCPDDIASIL